MDYLFILERSFMSFQAKSFVFDSTPSEMYDIVISSDGDTGTSPIGDIELMTTKIWRRPSVYLYGVSQKPVLQFPIILHNINGGLTAHDLSLISTWLFGQQNYKKLQIVQDDMFNIYFNCFFTQPEVVRIGNIIVGVKATIVCDSPFAKTFPITHNTNYASPPSSASLVFDNYSDDSYYLFPTVEFTITGAGGGVSITNTTDDGRIFSFETLSPGETISVNNDLQIITSSLTLNRMAKFNKKFFRFLRGRNTLSVTGNINNLKFIYSLSKKIGG